MYVKSPPLPLGGCSLNARDFILHTHTHTRTRQPLPLQNRTLHGIVLLGGNFFSVARDWVTGSLLLHSFFLLSTSHHHSLTHARTHTRFNTQPLSDCHPSLTAHPSHTLAVLHATLSPSRAAPRPDRIAFLRKHRHCRRFGVTSIRVSLLAHACTCTNPLRSTPSPRLALTSLVIQVFGSSPDKLDDPDLLSFLTAWNPKNTARGTPMIPQHKKSRFGSAVTHTLSLPLDLFPTQK
jgi:hypothetical protein